MNLEAQKREPIYEALERFRKKRVVPVVAANRVGEERLMEDRLSGTVPGQTAGDVWKNMFRSLNNQGNSDHCQTEKNAVQ